MLWCKSQSGTINKIYATAKIVWLNAEATSTRELKHVCKWDLQVDNGPQAYVQNC